MTAAVQYNKHKRKEMLKSRFATHIFIAELALRYAEKALSIGIHNGTITKVAKKMAQSAISDISVIRSAARKHIYLKEEFDESHARHCEVMQKDINVFYYTCKSWLDKNREEDSSDKAVLLVALAMTSASVISYQQCSSLTDVVYAFPDMRLADPTIVCQKIKKIIQMLRIKDATADPLVERAWTIIVQKIASNKTLDYISQPYIAS